MNLFENIFNTAKSGLSSYNKYMGEVGSNLYDAQQNVQLKQQGNVIQSFLNESQAKPEMQSKRKAVVQMLQNGEDDSFIQDTITNKMGYDSSVGVGGRIASALGNRLQTAGESYTQDKSGIEKGLSAVKDVIATPFDVIGAVAQPVIQPIVETAMETPYLGAGIKAVGEGYGNFREANPRLAQNVEAVAGIGSALAPFTKTGQAVIKAPGKALVQGAKYVAPKVVSGVKKLTPTLPKAQDLLVKQLEKTNRVDPTIYRKFLETSKGEPAGKFLADRGITGNAEENVTKLWDNFQKSKDQADLGLATIQRPYKMGEVPEAFTDMLGELNTRFAYTKDIESLSRVRKALQSVDNGSLSHADINDIKRLYEKKVKVNYIKDQNSLEVERATNVDDAVRSWQFDEADKLGFGNLREINRETQLNRLLADAIGNKVMKQSGNNNMSLTDWIIAGQVPATPEAIALLAGKKLAQNIVPKIYQKGLEKLAKIPKKQSPIADIENIRTMEEGRKIITPKYDTSRLIAAPLNNSRSPRLITSEVTLPKGEKLSPTTKSPAVKSDITTESKILRPSSKPTPQKSVAKKLTPISEKATESMTKGDAVLYRKNGKIYAKDNAETREALKRSHITVETDGEIKKQLTFYPEDDFRPDIKAKPLVQVTPKSGEIDYGKIKQYTKRIGVNSSNIDKVSSEAMNEIKKLPSETGVFYKGISGGSQYPITGISKGSIIDGKKIESVSSNINQSKEFAKNTRQILEIETSSAKNIEKYSEFPQEKESILLGGNYEVLSIKNKGGYEIIRVRHINSTPKPLSNESKLIKPTPSNTIPEGYTKNAFGEIIKKPSNKTGGFIKIPGIEKTYSPEGAIRTYTNSSDKINKMLREGKEYPQIEALDKFLTETKKYNGTVYRGLTVDDGKYNSIVENIRKNGIKDKAYTSTTENYGDATTYSRNSKIDGKKGIMFEIESKNGRVIDRKYNAYNEEEILFPRNTEFEYVGEYNDVGRGLIIKLKEKASPKKLK